MVAMNATIYLSSYGQQCPVECTAMVHFKATITQLLSIDVH